MAYITAKDNPRIKLVKSLRSSHGRKKSGLYFIEGSKLIQEAVMAGERIEFVLYSTDFTDEHVMVLLSANDIPSFAVSPAVFDDIADTVTPQGILAVLRQKQVDWHDVVSMDRFLLLMLDAVQDPGNVGTMIRTADAMGFTAILAGEGSVDQYNPKVLRAAMGSSFHLPVYGDVPLENVMQSLEQKGASVLAAVPRGGISLDAVPVTDKMAIIIGNEARGISQRLVDKVSCAVSISMPGHAESLNASVAAGIMMYELSRRWHVRR